MADSFDLYRTTPEGSEWLGSFLDLESAIAELKKLAAITPAYYCIYDQTTRRRLFAENSSKLDNPTA